MVTIFVLLLFFSLSALILGLIYPSLFSWLFKSKTSRKNIALIFGIFAVLLFATVGFISNDKKTQEIKTITERPTTDEEWVQGIVFQGVLAELALRYAEATVHTDAFFKDAPTLGDEERLAFLDQTIQKWTEAKVAAEQFSAVAELLPDYDAAVSHHNGSRFSLIEEVLAATVEEDIEKAWQKKKELGEEKLLQLIDKAPMGQRVQEAAKIFGTSIEVAYVVLQDLREQETKKSLKEAERYDTYSKAAQTIQTGAKVAIYVGGVAAGGGMVTLAGKAAHVVITSVAGAGLVMDASQTAVDIGIADPEGGEWSVAAIAKAKEAPFFKKASIVVGITDITKAVGQFTKVAEAAGGVKKLLTADGLKKISQNAEVMKELKENVSGNLQTTVDSGSATREFLTNNPDVNTVVVDAASSGKVVLTGTNKAIAVKELPTAKAVSDFVRGIFSEAQKTGAEVPQETAETVTETKPDFAPAPVSEPKPKSQEPVVKPKSQEPVVDTAKIENCTRAEKDYYNIAVDSLSNLRNPSYGPKWNCSVYQAAYQEYPPQNCCDIYESNRWNDGDSAWYDMQECGWRAEMKVRETAYNAKLASCSQ